MLVGAAGEAANKPLAEGDEGDARFVAVYLRQRGAHLLSEVMAGEGGSRRRRPQVEVEGERQRTLIGLGRHGQTSLRRDWTAGLEVLLELLLLLLLLHFLTCCCCCFISSYSTFFK